jgi:hypothetical protein
MRRPRKEKWQSSDRRVFLCSRQYEHHLTKTRSYNQHRALSKRKPKMKLTTNRMYLKRLKTTLPHYRMKPRTSLSKVTIRGVQINLHLHHRYSLRTTRLGDYKTGPGYFATPSPSRLYISYTDSKAKPSIISIRQRCNRYLTDWLWQDFGICSTNLAAHTLGTSPKALKRP